MLVIYKKRRGTTQALSHPPRIHRQVNIALQSMPLKSDRIERVSAYMGNKIFDYKKLFNLADKAITIQ